MNKRIQNVENVGNVENEGVDEQKPIVINISESIFNL
jgi:hypothetical protein